MPIDAIIDPSSPIPTPDRRVAIVTGANHGIGAAAAIALAATGVDVLVSYLRHDPAPDPSLPDAYGEHRRSGPEDVLAAIESLPGRAVAVEVDLLDDDSATRLFDEAERVLGPVSILVNNASGWVADTFAPAADGVFGRSLAGVTAASIDRNLGVDARAAALLIAELARRHIARGATWGRIVGLTSGGPQGFPQEVSYGAAKAALENYTMSASAELRRFGITSNLVHPPITDTGWINDEVRAFVAESTEYPSVAVPEEVATVVAWLCSDAAERVTGNMIRMY